MPGGGFIETQIRKELSETGSHPMDDAKGIQRVEQLFLAAAWDPSRWEDALQGISDEMGATGCGLLPVSGNIPRAASSPGSQELFHAYFMGGLHEHDVRRKLGIPTLLRDGAAIEHDFITSDEIARSPFYNDLLGKVNFRWFGGIKLQTDDDIWCVALQRTIREGPFNHFDKAKLAYWGQRLSAASMLAAEVSRVKHKGISDLLEALGKPSLLLNRAGEVTNLNKRAEALVGQAGLIRNRKLKFSDRAATETFDKAWRMVLDPRSERHSYGPIVVRRSGKRPLLLSLLSLDFSDFNPLRSARIIVLLNDLDEHPMVMAEQLRLVFGLTGAESRLCEMIADGTSLGEAAEKLGVTRETTKSQLKAVFGKTDTNRQAELVAMIARVGEMTGRKN